MYYTKSTHAQHINLAISLSFYEVIKKYPSQRSGLYPWSL